MITFIICSLEPAKASAVEKNVRETVGVPCEFVIEDNRIKKMVYALYITIAPGKHVVNISVSCMRMSCSMETVGDSLS